MKSLTRDILFSLVCFIIILTASVLLYFQLTARISHIQAEQIGTISFKRKVAERKFSERSIWEGLDQLSPVYNYDSIRTASNSEAIVHLQNGTEIMLDENTLIFLKVEGKDVGIDFSKGSISANSSKDKPETKINIQSPEALINVEKGKIDISKSNERINFNLSDGNAVITNKKGSVFVSKDQSASIDKEEIDLISYDISLKLPRSNFIFVTDKDQADIPFSWIYDKKDDFNFELYKGKKILFSRKIKGNLFNISLGEGAYSWRIIAASDSKASSMTGKFSILKDIPAQIISPLDDPVSGDHVRIEWSKSLLSTSGGLE